MATYTSKIDFRNYYVSKDTTSKNSRTTNFFNTGYLSNDVIDTWKKDAHLPSNLTSNMCGNTSFPNYCSGAVDSFYPVKPVPLPKFNIPFQTKISPKHDCTRYVTPP